MWIRAALICISGLGVRSCRHPSYNVSPTYVSPRPRQLLLGSKVIHSDGQLHLLASSVPSARLGVCRMAPEKEVYLCHISPTAAPLTARVVQRGPWVPPRRTWHDRPQTPHRT